MKRICTRAKLVSFVLCTTGALLLFLAGCRKEEKAPEIPASSPASYMKDPVFRKELKDRRVAAAEIGERRERVNAGLAACRKRVAAALKTDDAKAIDAALAKDETWQQLQAEGKVIDAEFMANHRETMRLVRERITPIKGKREQGTGKRAETTSNKGISK